MSLITQSVDPTGGHSPGVGVTRPHLPQRPLRWLEWAVLIHLSIFVIAITWGFGGAAIWFRPILSWWGTLGLLLTVVAIVDRQAWREGWMKPLGWLLPLVLFNLLVLVSCLNPSFRELRYESEVILAPLPVGAGWPTSARPTLALPALWLFTVIWISCFNLTLILRQRRAVRALLVVIALNALVLAVFGTVQKLARVEGLYFGAVSSPQKHFFSSFVYHNHWGAFTLLATALCLGLVWHYARRRDDRDFFHSPALGGLVAVLLLATTVPLSNSRSSTLLILALFAATFVHWVTRLIRKRRRFQESIAVPLGGALAALILAGAGIWFVAQDSIATRVALTRDQVGEMRAMGGLGARVDLYRDTWRMARDRPWFGWGMASYPHVFRLYNTREWEDRIMPRFYRDAHSDWLQSLAEHGFIGSALLALCALLPARHLRLRHLTSPLPAYLLAGCTLVLLYAWIEFPFGNLAVVLTWWLCFFSAVHYARLYDREAAAPPRPASPHT